MSKKKKKHTKTKSIVRDIEKEADLYDDLPDGLLEVLSDEKYTNVCTLLYLTLFAFMLVVIIALFFIFNQYKILAELVNTLSQTTAVHIPAGDDIGSFSGTIKSW